MFDGCKCGELPFSDWVDTTFGRLSGCTGPFQHYHSYYQVLGDRTWAANAVVESYPKQFENQKEEKNQNVCAPTKAVCKFKSTYFYIFILLRSNIIHPIVYSINLKTTLNYSLLAKIFFHSTTTILFHSQSRTALLCFNITVKLILKYFYFLRFNATSKKYYEN